MTRETGFAGEQPVLERLNLLGRAFAVTLAVSSIQAIGCVEAREPPPIPLQVEVPYGPRVFLIDHTFATPATSCTRFAAPMTTTSTTQTATVVAVDGLDAAIDPRVPHNCFVNVRPKSLKVDVIEATNDLFQLCVDSGACEGPDPSQASKSQGCSETSRFDTCPVVQVPRKEAVAFCKFIGRRLPSGIEHIIMRQAGANDAQSPAGIPAYPNGKNEKQPPTSCSDAVLAISGCRRPQPTTPADPKGAAEADLTGGVFDLMGNAIEWSSDLLPAIRPAPGLPWFCQGPLSTAAGERPACPGDAACVFGQYQPQGFGLGEYPVCIAFTDFQSTSGAHGSLFGGSFATENIDRQRIGVFARKLEKNPDEEPEKDYGFRCTGDLASDDRVESAR